MPQRKKSGRGRKAPLAGAFALGLPLLLGPALARGDGRGVPDVAAPAVAAPVCPPGFTSQAIVAPREGNAGYTCVGYVTAAPATTLPSLGGGSANPPAAAESPVLPGETAPVANAAKVALPDPVAQEVAAAVGQARSFASTMDQLGDQHSALADSYFMAGTGTMGGQNGFAAGAGAATPNAVGATAAGSAGSAQFVLLPGGDGKKINEGIWNPQDPADRDTRGIAGQDGEPLPYRTPASQGKPSPVTAAAPANPKMDLSQDGSEDDLPGWARKKPTSQPAELAGLSERQMVARLRQSLGLRESLKKSLQEAQARAKGADELQALWAEQAARLLAKVNSSAESLDADELTLFDVVHQKYVDNYAALMKPPKYRKTASVP